MFETYIYIHIFILDTLRVLYRNYCAPTPCPQNVDNQNAVLYCYYYLPFPTLFFFILIPLLTLTKVGHLENQVRKISWESEVPCCENSPEPSTLRPPYLSPLVFFFLFSFLFFFFLVWSTTRVNQPSVSFCLWSWNDTNLLLLLLLLLVLLLVSCLLSLVVVISLCCCCCCCWKRRER